MSPELTGRLSRLPDPAADAVRRALTPGENVKDCLNEAFRIVTFPEGHIYPLPENLTDPQRALVEILALCENLHPVELPFALPSSAADQRRWLGLEPPGVLEEPVNFTLNGVEQAEPLWRALQRLRITEGPRQNLSACAPLLNSFPLAKRLQVYEALFPKPPYAYGYVYGLQLSALEGHGLHLIDKGDDAAWAAATANALLERAAINARYNPQNSLSSYCERNIVFELRQRVFGTLVRENIAIDPRWDILLPLPGVLTEASLADAAACIQAIPEDRRTPAIVAALRHKFSREIVDTGTALLKAFPSEELLACILQHIDRSGRPKRYVLEDLSEIANAHVQLKKPLEEYIRHEPPPLFLHCVSVINPKTQQDLTPLECEQLTLACSYWDGNELPLEQRLPPTPDTASGNEPGEECVVGLVDVYRIHNEQGEPAYNAFIFLHDDGTFFKADSLDDVAVQIQGNLDCEDRQLKDALHAAIYSAPESESE